MAEEKRDSIIFYRSFYEAIKEMPPAMQGKVYSAIFEYSLNFNEVILNGLPKTIFTLIKPQLDANNRRYTNGKKGGKPKQDETETEPKPNLDPTKTEPNKNVNDNGNVNDNSKENEIEEPEEIPPPPPIPPPNNNMQPNIPTLETVEREFNWAGGNSEMAKKFFDKYEAVGWFKNGAPIKNFKYLLDSFITNWNKNEKNGTNKPNSDTSWQGVGRRELTDSP